MTKKRIRTEYFRKYRHAHPEKLKAINAKYYGKIRELVAEARNRREGKT